MGSLLVSQPYLRLFIPVNLWLYRFDLSVWHRKSQWNQSCDLLSIDTHPHCRSQKDRHTYTITRIMVHYFYFFFIWCVFVHSQFIFFFLVFWYFLLHFYFHISFIFLFPNTSCGSRNDLTRSVGTIWRYIYKKKNWIKFLALKKKKSKRLTKILCANQKVSQSERWEWMTEWLDEYIYFLCCFLLFFLFFFICLSWFCRLIVNSQKEFILQFINIMRFSSVLFCIHQIYITIYI